MDALAEWKTNMIVDMHVHSSFSDGTLSPSVLMRRANEAGLNHLCLTDHDTVGGVTEAIKAGFKVGIGVIPGVELTCSFEGMEFHVLGIGVNHQDPDFVREMDLIAGERFERSRKIVNSLCSRGWEINREFLCSADGIITSHDIAKAVINKEVSSFDFHNEWLTKESGCFVPMKYIPIEDGISMIQAAGGRAIWAHPLRTLEECDIKPRFYEITGKLVSMGIDGMETFYSFSSPGRIGLVSHVADHYGLLKTGGSDYHGPGHIGRCSLGDFMTHGFEFNAYELLEKLNPSAVRIPCRV